MTLGTMAIDIVCPTCDAQRDQRCRTGTFCPERVKLAAKITRKTNQKRRENE